MTDLFEDLLNFFYLYHQFLNGSESPTKNNASHYFIQVFDKMKQIGVQAET